ncbi:hypothetical protein shim_27280 [Shimia sp. SK013]|uniref:hypothetical protein n=1 Tax=Shimia sp. SK013 TaxID=1389006 RepID=UPI0006B67690|nr:hypothetical protein [Shimia sp. SK013]KPA21263.1 hypothetical protein shim_27280 [Shimia sp. SK013]
MQGLIKQGLVAVFVVLGAVALPVGTSSFALAQALTDGDMDELSLTKFDTIIEDIERRVELVRVGSVGLQNDSKPAQSSAESDVVAIPATSRSRTNPSCFQDSDYGLTSPELLDAYFGDVETAVKDAGSFLTSFAGLKALNKQGNCPSFMTDILKEAKARLADVPRVELLDVTYHLESCWPDSGVLDSAGAELDMDQKYGSARQMLSLYGDAQRIFREAAGWCE